VGFVGADDEGGGFDDEGGGVVDRGGGVVRVGVGHDVGGCGRVGRDVGGVGRVVGDGAVVVVDVGPGGVLVVPWPPGAPQPGPWTEPGPRPELPPAPPSGRTGTGAAAGAGPPAAGTDAAGTDAAETAPSSPGPGSGARCARRSTCGPAGGAGTGDAGPRSVIVGVAAAVGTTTGPCGVGVDTANRPPRPGAIASEVEVPVTVWKTAVLTAAAPMSDTPATATRRRRTPVAPSPPVRRSHAAPDPSGPATPPPAPADAVLGSTVSSCCSRAASPRGGHGTRAPALGLGAVY